MAIRTDEEAQAELDKLRELAREYENMGMHHAKRGTLDFDLFELMKRKITVLEKGAPF